MTDLPPLPLLTYRPDWEAQWDAAEARYVEIKALVFGNRFGALPAAEQARRRNELASTGGAMCRLYEAQFRTTDEYRDWRLNWFNNEIGWQPRRGFEMPRGLPVLEIRQRLTAALAFRSPGDAQPLTEPSFAWQMKVHAILAAPPSADTRNFACALARAGGDRV